MEKEKRKIRNWIKEHKKELILSGISITMIILTLVGISNSKEIEQFLDVLNDRIGNRGDCDITVLSTDSINLEPPKAVTERTISLTKAPHEVSEHLRNLPQGWNASPSKMLTAVEHGYNLIPGQTWVESYRTGGTAA